MRVLIIEDDPAIAANLYDFLESRGHLVDAAADGVTGLHLAVTGRFDAIVLDLGLPGMDGNALCRKLREEAHDDTPVLMLTARDTLEDKLEGFARGADDYLVKPFDLDELAARVRALLRRQAGRAEPLVRFGELALNPVTREVTQRGEPVPVSAREFALLQALLERPGATLSRAQLEERIYGWGEEVASNSVEVHVHNLRKKLGERVIRTVRGVGYSIADERGAPAQGAA